MNIFIPENLKIARDFRGFSQTALARLLSVPQSTVSRWESGQLIPTLLDVQALSEALGFSTGHFGRSASIRGSGLPDFYHRKLARAKVGDVNRIHSYATIVESVIAHLIDVVGIANDNVPQVELAHFNGDVDAVSKMLRAMWRLPRGPVDSVVKTLEDAGIIVVPFDQDVDGVHAFCRWVPGLPPLFFVNVHRSWDMIRFSLIHELGHTVLHAKPVDAVDAEGQADTFAASFLMPKADIYHELRPNLGLPDLARLKVRWKTSMQAILRRSKDLSRVDPRRYKYLMIEIGRRGWRRLEPVEVQREQPLALAHLLRSYAHVTNVDLDQLAHALSVPDELVQMWIPLQNAQEESILGGTNGGAFMRIAGA